MILEAPLPDETLFGEERPAAPPERRRLTGAAIASGAAHVLVLALLIGLWRAPLEQDAPAPVPVTLTQDPVGAAGASGGGNSTSTASSRADASNTAPDFATAQASRAQAAVPAPAPPVPTPPAETPSPPSDVLPLPLPQTAHETPAPPPPRKPSPPHPPKPSTAATTPPPPQPQSAPPQPAAPSSTVAQAAQTPNATQTESLSRGDVATEAGAGGHGRGEEGAGRAALGHGAPEGLTDDYLDEVQRWIARFRTYPDAAKKEKQEGTVSIGFKFARDGTVLDAWIEKSSGFPLLDDAALKMIHAASPIPKVPDSYKGETLTLVMPERFRIGIFDRLFN